MTKKELEKKYKFVLGQLEMIHAIAKNCNFDENEIPKTIGRIDFLSDPKYIKEKLEFIEKYDKHYNFFNKTEDISDYE